MALKKLTGFWVNETKEGEKYFSSAKSKEKTRLVMDVDAKLFVFKNKYFEEGGNQPEYNLMFDTDTTELIENDEVATPPPSTRVETSDELPF